MADGKRVDIPYRVKRLVWQKSHNHCAKCFKKLTEVLPARSDLPSSEVALGKCAHICGERPGSERYDTTISETQRNSEQNLMLLCEGCHDEIDVRGLGALHYPVEILRKMRAEHYRKCEELLARNVANVSFDELKQVCDYLVKDARPTVADFERISLENKIRKNDLSPTVERQISAGMLREAQVRGYVQHREALEPNFASNIVGVFKEKYLALRQEQYTPDEIFHALWDFATVRKSDFLFQAAGLSVLVYLFHACEVFEK